jgi:hypothetical protein
VPARLLRLLTVAVALAALAHPAAWAAPSPIFTRVQNGPVLQPTTGFFDDYMTASPSVVWREGRYHMVYTGHCSKPAGYTPILPPSLTCPEDAGIFLLGATSPDGVHWTKKPEPIIRPLPGRRWMGAMTEAELVAGPDGWFYLFFTGNGPLESRSIGVARSREPFGPWDINPNPILTGRPWPLSGLHKVLAPSVHIDEADGGVLMWFNGTNQLEFGWDIYAATSTWPLRTDDGWSKWRFANGGERAVIGPYDGGSGDPSVIVKGRRFHMFLTCGSPEFNGPPGICHATSDDGLRFDLEPNLDALLPRSGSWDENLETAFVLPTEEGYLMWYLGFRSTGYHTASLGLATAAQL